MADNPSIPTTPVMRMDVLSDGTIHVRAHQKLHAIYVCDAQSAYELLRNGQSITMDSDQDMLDRVAALMAESEEA